jgi:hypothetical protein
MLIRVLLLLLLCSVARAEGQSQEQENGTRSPAPERRPASNSIPHFDHSPGEQRSIPAGNSIPGKPADRTQE